MGRVSVTVAMLTSAWNAIQVVIAVASTRPSASGARSAAR